MFDPVEPTAAELARLETLPDGELVHLLKAGQDEAMGVLLRRHSEALYRFCCHLMPNRVDAEDIAQETMARAIGRAHGVQSGSAFRSWLFSIARNLSVDSYRANKRLTPLPDDDDSSPIMLYQENPYEQVETHEEYQTVARAMGTLAKSHQTVLMMREVEGLSYTEIAQRLNVSHSAVETLLFRARRRLREEYTKSSSPVPSFTLLGAFRGLLARAWGPVSGGTPLAAKVAVGALIAGTAVSLPHVVPLIASSHAAMVKPTSTPVTNRLALRHAGTPIRLSHTPRGTVSIRALHHSTPTSRPAHRSATVTHIRPRHTGAIGRRAHPVPGGIATSILASRPTAHHHPRPLSHAPATGSQSRHYGATSATATRVPATPKAAPTQVPAVLKSASPVPTSKSNPVVAISQPQPLSTKVPPAHRTRSGPPKGRQSPSGKGQRGRKGTDKKTPLVDGSAPKTRHPKPVLPVARGAKRAVATAQATVVKAVHGAPATVGASLQATASAAGSQVQAASTAVARGNGGVGSTTGVTTLVPTVAVPTPGPKPAVPVATLVIKVATPSVKVPTPPVKEPATPVKVTGPPVKLPTPTPPHVP